MFINDLAYLEVEVSEVQGAGYSYFRASFRSNVDAQRIAELTRDESLNVYADARKTISYGTDTYALAEV